MPPVIAQLLEKWQFSGLFLTLFPYSLLPLTYKKTAPGIPRTVLKEPILSDKPGSLLPEVLEVRVAAVAADTDGFGIVQAHHADKAFSVDLPVFVTHRNTERLHGGKGNEFFHVPKGTYADGKLMHIDAPHSVQI